MAPFGMFKRKKREEDAGDAGTTAEPAPDAETLEPEPEAPRGVLGRLRSSLEKTRRRIAGGLRGVLTLHRSLNDEVIEELEEQLYMADVGPRAVIDLMEGLREAYRAGEIEDTNQVLEFLKARMKAELAHWDCTMHLPEEGPAVIMVAGVNGAGKTTSIAKLAAMYVAQGKKVLLAASDTFRAAAVEQLEIWSERVGADIVKNESADPAAVAFDAAEKALANGYDVLIIDTAGRLHTRSNLMMELQKVHRVVGSRMPGAPHETLMVLDANTGQNAISQALKFRESINITGILLAKLDGTAKGGIVFGMRHQVDVPVKFVGLGEKAGDLMPFDPDSFVDALFG